MTTPTDPAHTPLAAPSAQLLAAEIRVIPEWLIFQWALHNPQSALHQLPHGDGHPVLVVPGFGASDRETRTLRKALNALGYAAHGWGLGRNLGMRTGTRERLDETVQTLSEQGRVSLIGWSLGGIFAREIARRQPDLIRRVFTLGSPFNGDPLANNMMPLFRLANRGQTVKIDREGFERRKQAPPVPCVAIYSRTDGIVAWPCSREQEAANTENVEIEGSHFGLVNNLEVLGALANRLHLP